MTKKTQSIILACLWLSLSSLASNVPDLQTWHIDEGEAGHKFMIEAKGEFRLGFVRSMNYGLSEWYDLRFDPEAKSNLTRRDLGEAANGFQGALFNQVINPHDVIAHIGLAGTRFKDEPRNFKIIENNARRVIVEATYFTMLSSTVTKEFSLTTRYVIYPTGRIYIHNTMNFLKDYTLTTWRHATISLGDPQHYAYGTKEKGTVKVIGDNKLRNSQANWKPGSLKNMLLHQPQYNTWLILDNTETELTIGKQTGGRDPLKSGSYDIGSHETIYGWMRGDNNNNPTSWSQDEARYCFTYWDKKTPEPFKDYSRASILLAPSPENEIRGTAQLHSWIGFKRQYFGGDFKISRKKGDEIHQQYLMQIGAENSTLLPNIRNKEVAAPYADSYLKPQKGLDFDRKNGVYLFDIKKQTEFTVSANEPKPVLICHSLNNQPKIYLNNDLLKAGRDYLLTNVDKDYLIQFTDDWKIGDVFKFTEK